ncbi:MAG TPA: DUF2264 domain-containing protein [Acidobacteriaceae bacterium]
MWGGRLRTLRQKTPTAPRTFDDKGWLRIGLGRHQPSLGEDHISTGSLYLCAAAFLPRWDCRPRTGSGAERPLRGVR